MPDLIKVLVVENETLTRLGIRSVLESEPDIQIIAEAANAAEGIEAYRNTRPDVAILALRMPDSCVIDNLADYFNIDSRARIIVLAAHAGDAEITRALRKGALGYICKDVTSDDLVAAVRTVNQRRKYIPPEIAGVLSQYVGEEELTPTEANVLRMIVGGMSNKEIAFALDVSENTIKTHVQNIFAKIGVSDRTSAATLAIKRGLVRVDL